jgi:hypothetical protein
MSGLLTTLLAFVGIILILALAAQSIQEIIKTMFTFKGTAQLTARNQIFGYQSFEKRHFNNTGIRMSNSFNKSH